MVNKPKRKGTSGETELLRLLTVTGLNFERTAPSKPYDLVARGYYGPGAHGTIHNALATRPDNGQWLVSIPLEDYIQLVTGGYDLVDEWRIEVKRYARFALHTIFESKFGKGKA